MSKVRCAYCKTYLDRDRAFRHGLSSFCDSSHYIEYKREERKRQAVKATKSSKLSPSFREEILSRDGYKCRICQEQSVNKLHLHHIKYRSEAPHLVEQASNVITLCRECHRTVHGDKTRWQPILMNIVV